MTAATAAPTTAAAPRPSPIRRWHLPAVLATLLLTACAAALDPQLYTLMPASMPTATAPQPVRMLVQMAPVRVPDALDRTDVLVTHSAVQVQRLPHALWRSPYAEEVQDAVLAGILSDGGIARMPRTASTQQGILPTFELNLTVDRMDMAPQQLARLDVTWAVRPLHAAPHPRPADAAPDRARVTGGGRAPAADAAGTPRPAGATGSTGSTDASGATGAISSTGAPGAAGVVCRAHWQVPLADADIAHAIAAQQQLIQRWAQRIRWQLVQATSAQGVLDCGTDAAAAAIAAAEPVGQTAQIAQMARAADAPRHASARGA